MRRTIVIRALLAATLSSPGALAFAAGARALRPGELSRAVRATRIETLRAGDRGLSDDEFHGKMKAALRSPLHLKQTFPGLLGTMLRPLVRTRALPGEVAPIGFDAHVENAGIVRLGKDRPGGRSRSIATLIDVDDSGLGPAGVDAVSLGASLVQRGYGKRVVKKAIRAFARAATEGASGPEAVEGPRWGKLRRRWIEKNTRDEKRDGKKILSFKDGERAAPDRYAAIERAARRDGVLRDYDVLDVAEHGKRGGGSGGLTEFMVLAQRRGTDKLRVYLLKEQKAPAVRELGIGQPSGRERIGQLQAALWQEVPKDVLFPLHDVKLPGERPTDFLVRNKFAMVGDDTTGKDKDRTAVKVARLYGRAHAGQFGDLTAPELADWTRQSTRSVVKAFAELRDRLAASFDRAR